MSKPALLQLEPTNELHFNGPFTDVVPSTLTLNNITDRPVNFKVKTTAPRFYCVRPNSGQILPGQGCKVNVLLQPVEQAQTLEKERSRHKFMVQSAYANDDSVENFWKTVDPGEVIDARLKVVFHNLNVLSDTIQSNVTDTTAPEPYKTFEQSPQLQRRSVNVESSAPKPLDLSPPAPAPSVRSLNRGSSGDKQIEEENRQLSQQVQELRHKLSALALNASSVEGFPTLQVILLTLAALLIGIIVGKLF